ncbi:hypothetical protein AURDEDRAFT_177288 [Auricularia subglabra TFB-10046 SS5]|uniref:DUF6589 domain-containing protein n=1 Tax=Auricularia subglabra (strain TFB-10046 / SS5) TaxID=717982 RepID=J0LB22_AURST|nr:hypothetical protein AURDEDRAFT_177288 [Auricularia subglabra TFB-10046 SS5]
MDAPTSTAFEDLQPPTFDFLEASCDGNSSATHQDAFREACATPHAPDLIVGEYTMAVQSTGPARTSGHAAPGARVALSYGDAHVVDPQAPAMPSTADADGAGYALSGPVLGSTHVVDPQAPATPSTADADDTVYDPFCAPFAVSGAEAGAIYFAAFLAMSAVIADGMGHFELAVPFTTAELDGGAMDPRVLEESLARVTSYFPDHPPCGALFAQTQGAHITSQGSSAFTTGATRHVAPGPPLAPLPTLTNVPRPSLDRSDPSRDQPSTPAPNPPSFNMATPSQTYVHYGSKWQYSPYYMSHMPPPPFFPGVQPPLPPPPPPGPDLASSAQKARPKEKRRSPLVDSEKVEKFFSDFLKQVDWTFPEFMMMFNIFRHTNDSGQHIARSPPHAAAVSKFQQYEPPPSHSERALEFSVDTPHTEINQTEAFMCALGRDVNNEFVSLLSLDVSSLGHSTGVADRSAPSNLKKPDFHSTTELRYLIQETRMTDCWSLLLGEDDIPTYIAKSSAAGTLPTLDTQLSNAQKLHCKYSSTKAAHAALQPYDKQPIDHESRAPLARPKAPTARRTTPARSNVSAGSPSDGPTIPLALALVGSTPSGGEHANEPETRIAGSPVADPRVMSPDAEPETGTAAKEHPNFSGDRWLANSIIGLRNFIRYRHWSRATALGHAGDIWENFKIEKFQFAGSGHNPKYRDFCLEMFISVEFEYSDEMRNAVLNSLLVNPSGRRGHFKECDLLQEHLINRLDRHMQHRDKSYDDPFIRDVVTPNLHHLVEVPRQLESAVDLVARASRHLPMHQRSEAGRLRKTYRENQLHSFSAGRSTGFAVKDYFDAGYAALASEHLENFLKRHRWETQVLHRETPPSHQQRRDAVAQGLPYSATPDIMAAVDSEDAQAAGRHK